MTEVVLHLPTPPSANRLWKTARLKMKGSVLGRSFVYPSAEYKAWLAEANVSYGGEGR